MSTTIDKVLYDLCLKAQANAYAPYSNFKVGACLVTNNNNAYLGSNIENKAYGSTICAERSALSNAYSNGVKKEDIKYFGLLSDSDKISFPCGECLQVMNELLSNDTNIYLFDKNGKFECVKINDIFPYHFGKEND
ncbi:MAG: cytidine deaminase [Bacilli bacterium]|nr:cytidine deaminase [Bacilli bacterium]